MSMFAVDGLISGLNTSTLVSQLMQVESIPKQRLQIRVNQQAADIQAYQSLATVLKKVADAAGAIAKPGTWTATQAVTTGDAATATARTGAAVGSYDITVSELARAATFTTQAAYGLDDVVVAPGGLQVTRADGSAVSLPRTTGSLREAMNAINTDESLGLRAIAVRVGEDSYRLQLASTATGAAQGQLAVSGFDAAVALDVMDGRDAVYTVNGLEGTSATNDVADLVPGLDVTFTRLSGATPTNVTVAPDRTSTADSIAALVGAANDALAELRKQTAAGAPGSDGAAGTGRGALASDTLVRGLAGRIQQAVTDALGGVSASVIGIQTTREGGLVLDRAALDAAIAADPARVRALVSPADGSVGIAKRLAALVDSATNAGTGFLTSAVQGREQTKRDLEAQVISWDRRLELRQVTLQRQFSGLEVALGRLQSQSTYLSGQLAGLQANMSSNR